MFPADRKALKEIAIVVEYDSRGKRVRKTLANSFDARYFYQRKHREGKNPKIVSKSTS